MTEQKKGLSQEVIKLIACVTMLIDHIGASMFPNNLWLRVIGRVSFPIYCFLLVEGVYYTKHPVRYALRLFIGMLLAEAPFDLLFSGRWSWAYQSVMVTLLLSYGMLQCMKRIVPFWGKLLVILPFALVAELLNTDYGALGVCMVALFMLTRENPHRIAIQAFFLCLLPILYQGVWSLEPLCIMALLPIELYSGRKATSSQAVQWAFYLFYPTHLAILAIFVRVLR